MIDASQLAAAQAEFWNGPLTRGWVTDHERLDRAFAGLTEALLQAAAPRPGERAIDIGCATGTTLLALAGSVGADGHVLGLDIAAASVARARERIAAAGLAQADAVAGDAATHPLPPGAADLLFSRFGVMFFGDPVGAFTRLRGALRPGGRFVAAVWRAPRENPWATEPFEAVRDLLPPQPVPGPEDPGQFAWADPARVRRILEGAGFRDVALTPHDPPIQLAGGDSATEAAEMSFKIGPVLRASAELSAEARAAVRARLETFFRARGVRLPGAIWIVTARA